MKLTRYYYKVEKPGKNYLKYKEKTNGNNRDVPSRKVLGKSLKK